MSSQPCHPKFSFFIPSEPYFYTFCVDFLNCSVIFAFHTAPEPRQYMALAQDRAWNRRCSRAHIKLYNPKSNWTTWFGLVQGSLAPSPLKWLMERHKRSPMQSLPHLSYFFQPEKEKKNRRKAWFCGFQLRSNARIGKGASPFPSLPLIFHAKNLHEERLCQNSWFCMISWYAISMKYEWCTQAAKNHNFSLSLEIFRSKLLFWNKNNNK